MNAEDIIRAAVLEAIATMQVVTQGNYQAIDAHMGLGASRQYRVVFLPLLPTPGSRSNTRQTQMRVQVLGVPDHNTEFVNEAAALGIFQGRWPHNFTGTGGYVAARFSQLELIQGPQRAEDGLSQFDLVIAVTYTHQLTA